MSGITADLVKQLRDATNVSMMECKRALVEAEGDLQKATTLLREKGMAVAAKRATKTTNQGIIASTSADDGKCWSLVEVNCETDFVARNEDFQSFVKELSAKACSTDNNLADEVKDEVIDKVAAIGENIVVRRNTRFVLQNKGVIASYIHLGGKVGVLVEVACEKDETANSEILKELAKDLSLHVAACNPRFLDSSEIPAEEIAAERAIYAKQVEGKPEAIVGKIVDGKIKKFYSDVCFVDQGFVKEDKKPVSTLLAEKSKELNDTLKIKRFVRYQLGA